MFYFFSKTLSYLLTPAGWLLLTLLIAFLTKNQVRRRRFVGLALGVFGLFGNSVLTNELALWWEYAPAPQPTVANPATAVVLTGGMMNVVKAVPDNRFLLGREADRAGQALFLYKSGAVQTILISGGTGDLPFQTQAARDEGQTTARFLTMAGVDPNDIAMENKSRNTHENAVFSARILRERFHTNRCVLIASAIHMRRAAACFRREGVVAAPFPGSFLSGPRQFAPGDWLLPHEQAFADSYALMKEIAGYGVYWAMGYL